jgi:ABC-type nitrate/sulfonate/bicarbonate transport system ATPase subunit
MNSYRNEKQEPVIFLQNVHKRFGRKTVLKDMSFEVREKELVCLLGPSGCGKSTVFNLLAGLLSPDEGEVFVSCAPGYMHQKDLLLPWKNILDNVTLPLSFRGEGKDVCEQRGRDFIKMAGLSGCEKSYPHELSGGMRQRANFLRTFFTGGRIMLLDEPFGGLDSITRRKMQKWLLTMKESLACTILFITHDIEEAILLSDKILFMKADPGCIKTSMVLDFSMKNKEERLTHPKSLEVKEKLLAYLKE